MTNHPTLVKKENTVAPWKALFPPHKVIINLTFVIAFVSGSFDQHWSGGLCFAHCCVSHFQCGGIPLYNYSLTLCMTNLDSILKSRDMTLPTKVHLVKAMVFPVVMYGCESWTVKKAECRKIDAFELWCWRRLLRVPWTARRSNQSILKDQSWVFIGRTDAEAETSILWSLHAKS